MRDGAGRLCLRRSRLLDFFVLFFSGSTDRIFVGLVVFGASPRDLCVLWVFVIPNRR